MKANVSMAKVNFAINLKWIKLNTIGEGNANFVLRAVLDEMKSAYNNALVLFNKTFKSQVDKVRPYLALYISAV